MAPMPEPSASSAIDRSSLTDREFLESLGDDALVTKQEAALYLRLSPRTIDDFCAITRGRRRVYKTRRKKPVSGKLSVRSSWQKLPHIKVGKGLRFTMGDLRRFLEERRVA